MNGANGLSDIEGKLRGCSGDGVRATTEFQSGNVIFGSWVPDFLRDPCQSRSDKTGRLDGKVSDEQYQKKS
jgi:hypothetical protein